MRVTSTVRSLVLRNNVLEVNKGGAAGRMNRLFGDRCYFVTKILEVSFRYGGGPTGDDIDSRGNGPTHHHL